MIIGSLPESLINFRGALLQALVSDNHEVIAVASGDSVQVLSKLKNMGVTYRSVHINRFGMNPLADLATVKSLFLLFRKEKPDIVFCYTVKPVIYGSIAAFLANVKKSYSMITGLGYVFQTKNSNKKWLILILKILYKIALYNNKKVFLQNTDDINVALKKKILKNKEQVVLINGSGVDTDFFDLQPIPSQTQFLMIARLLIDKGVCEYLQAAKIIKQRYPHIKCCLVGWMDAGHPNAIDKVQLDAAIQAGTIDYLGALADVRPAIGAASVYVLPSYYEGTPRSVLEAMSMGRPIITSNAPGCRQTVIEGENGYLVPIKNTQKLINAMEKFILNEGLAKTMGKASRCIAVDKYDVNKVNKSIMDAIDF